MHRLVDRMTYDRCPLNSKGVHSRCRRFYDERPTASDDVSRECHSEPMQGRGNGRFGSSQSLPWSCFRYTALMSRRVRSSTCATSDSAFCLVSSGNPAMSCWKSGSDQASCASLVRRSSAYGYCGYRELHRK